MSLLIKNLHAGIDGKPILQGIDLEVPKGEVHALMGPNGSGKSTLANVLAGHPGYGVYNGSISLHDIDLLDLGADERSLAGLYLAFQYPSSVPGVTVGKYLKRLAEVRLTEGDNLKIAPLLKDIREQMDFLEIDQDFINRYLNDGFSGGEKKRMEILQMLMIKPQFAVLDETDSGLDIDALRIVARGVNSLRSDSFSGLVITHYQRILDYIKPDRVHIMYQGKIVTSGGPEIVTQLEDQGYDWVKELQGEAIV